MNVRPYFHSITELVQKFRGRSTSPAEIYKLFLERVDLFQPQLGAYLFVNRHCELLTGAQSMLYGIPLAIKDLLDVAGQPTTAASQVLHYVADKDAPAVAKLRPAGALFMGKTNLHEFAFGGSGVIGNKGFARNPWNPDFCTGGSSSGSAAAVAAGLCAAALGTDTAGSIRLPASYCGIVGYKPTYGAISTEGVVPLASSYDHVGPMTRTVADAKILFKICAENGVSEAKTGFFCRIGVPAEYFFRDLDPEVERVTLAALHALENAGHELIDIDFKVDEDRTLFSYEAYAYHAKWVAECPERYQAETLRRIKGGAKVSAEAAAEAKKKLDAMRRQAADVFTGVDVLLTPTVPVLPTRIDDLLGNPDTLRQRELVMLRNTRPFNVLGAPAINIPWDLSASGLPVGIQLAAAPGRDWDLLEIAERVEAISPWGRRTPPGFE